MKNPTIADAHAAWRQRALKAPGKPWVTRKTWSRLEALRDEPNSRDNDRDPYDQLKHFYVDLVLLGDRRRLPVDGEHGAYDVCGEEHGWGSDGRCVWFLIEPPHESLLAEVFGMDEEDVDDLVNGERVPRTKKEARALAIATGARLTTKERATFYEASEVERDIGRASIRCVEGAQAGDEIFFVFSSDEDGEAYDWGPITGTELQAWLEEVYVVDEA